MNKSNFFKYLEQGGSVRMITFHGEPVDPAEPLGQPRKAEKVQSNAIEFNNGSWLYKNDVKATDVQEVAAGGARPAVSVGWAVYQLDDNPAEILAETRRV